MNGSTKILVKRIKVKATIKEAPVITRLIFTFIFGVLMSFKMPRIMINGTKIQNPIEPNNKTIGTEKNEKNVFGERMINVPKRIPKTPSKIRRVVSLILIGFFSFAICKIIITKYRVFYKDNFIKSLLFICD